MKPRLLSLMVVLLTLVASTPESAALGRGRFLRRDKPAVYHSAPSYHDTYHYLNSYYPKYYGGFHSRYFQDMGIPPGDIGLRGNGIFMTPW